MTFDYVTLSDLIGNAAREALEQLDIDKIIQEVKTDPEIMRLDREIEYLKAIEQIFEK